MFPVLVWMYARLAKREEQEAVVEFGDAYRRYAAQTPPFFPRLALKPTLTVITCGNRHVGTNRRKNR
jgi:hypothetical protein